jgi:hypothetical protein
MQPTYVEAPWGGYKQSGSAAAKSASGASRNTSRKQVYINLSEQPIGWYREETMLITVERIGRSVRTVRGNTLKIAEEIPENKYDFRPAPIAVASGKPGPHRARTGIRLPHSRQQDQRSEAGELRRR